MMIDGRSSTHFVERRRWANEATLRSRNRKRARRPEG